MKGTKEQYNWYKGKHLFMVFVSALFYFLFTILVAGSVNTVFPLLCELNHWDFSKILVTMTFSGYIGAFSVFLLGRFVEKKGAKCVAVVCVGASACIVALWGYISSLALFIVLMLLLRVFITGFQAVANPALVSAWFPRTKGIMLGFATMGIVFSDVFWSPYIPKAIGHFGAQHTFLTVGICYAVFCIVIVLFVKNTPEEAGTYPDGCKAEAVLNESEQKELMHTPSIWTVKKVLTTKVCWQIIFGCGLLWMSCSMFLNQIVPRVVSLGYTQDIAVRVLQISAVSALAGSFLLGLLDQKTGSKKALQILAGWTILMFVLALFMHKSVVFVWLAPIGIMGGVGGICNLIPSLMISIWGRYDFTPVNKVISCFHLLITSSAFSVIALFKGTKAGYDGMYVLCILLCVISLVLISRIKLNFLGRKEHPAMKS